MISSNFPLQITRGYLDRQAADLAAQSASRLRKAVRPGGAFYLSAERLATVEHKGGERELFGASGIVKEKIKKNLVCDLQNVNVALSARFDPIHPWEIFVSALKEKGVKVATIYLMNIDGLDDSMLQSMQNYIESFSSDEFKANVELTKSYQVFKQEVCFDIIEAEGISLKDLMNSRGKLQNGTIAYFREKLETIGGKMIYQSGKTEAKFSDRKWY